VVAVAAGGRAAKLFVAVGSLLLRFLRQSQSFQPFSLFPNGEGPGFKFCRRLLSTQGLLCLLETVFRLLSGLI